MHDDDDTDQELMALALEADSVSTAGELSSGQVTIDMAAQRCSGIKSRCAI